MIQSKSRPPPHPHLGSPSPPPRPQQPSSSLQARLLTRPLIPRFRWYKVKIKSSEPSDPPQIGLVPASYLTSPDPLRTVTALFDYAPALNEDGTLENDEEMEIVEGEELTLWEDEGDWVLVGRVNGKGVGFVPGSYVEVSCRGRGRRESPRVRWNNVDGG